MSIGKKVMRNIVRVDPVGKYYEESVTFRDELILALAGNPDMIAHEDTDLGDGKINRQYNYESSATRIYDQADAIIAHIDNKEADQDG